MKTVNLTLDDIIELYDSIKCTRVDAVSLPDFHSSLVRKISGCSEAEMKCSPELAEKLQTDACSLLKRVKRFKAKNSKTRAEVDRTVVVASFEIPEETVADEEDDDAQKRRRSKNPIDELSSKRQKYRRLEPLIALIDDVAKEENTEVPYLLGVILHHKYYHTNRRIADISKLLMNSDQDVNQKVSVPVASHLKSFCNLGREGYQKVIRSMKTANLDVLPSWKKVREYEKSLTPAVSELPDQVGVQFQYKDALEKSAERIIDQLETTPTATELTLEVKDGLDGSETHSVFNQNGV